MKNDIRVRVQVKAKPKMRRRIMILSDAGGLLIRDMTKKWFDYESGGNPAMIYALLYDPY
jgi:hypothetical protein